MPNFARFAVFGRHTAGHVPPVPLGVKHGGTDTGCEINQSIQQFGESVPLGPPVPLPNDANGRDVPTSLVGGAGIRRVGSLVAAERAETISDAPQVGGTSGTGGTLTERRVTSATYGVDDAFHFDFKLVEQVEHPTFASPVLRLANCLGEGVQEYPLDELIESFEERAAIREHDGGLCRQDAEAAAIEDILESIRARGRRSLAPKSSQTVQLPFRGLVGEWQHAISRISREVAPCPLFRRWPAVCRAVDHFLTTHAEAAVALGWGTLDLFGVHRLVGTIRVDCSGALMVSDGSRVAEVSADLIRFENGLAYRRQPWPGGGQGVPVWEYGR